MIYLVRVSAPVIKFDCEKLQPGYVKKFDAHFEGWTLRKEKKIAAAKAALLAANPGKTAAQLDAAIVQSAKQTFAQSSAEEKSGVCSDFYKEISQ